MKRYKRQRRFKVKKLFILLFIVMLCAMARKIPHSSFTVLHILSVDCNPQIINKESFEKDPDSITSSLKKLESVAESQ